jgi:hypothetical protein
MQADYARHLAFSLTNHSNSPILSRLAHINAHVPCHPELGNGALHGNVSHTSKPPPAELGSSAGDGGMLSLTPDIIQIITSPG